MSQRFYRYYLKMVNCNNKSHQNQFESGNIKLKQTCLMGFYIQVEQLREVAGPPVNPDISESNNLN